jgi:eukaryotic-like serine/threonine-protein kinase
MPSLVEGYSYDIFISYRQKDNKYDGWVTEFVNNLKKELESMFKDEITLYFDINPSDYLLESYDVNASLKEKLKCLVFIPVLSRTYCDPKAYAWENELKAFISQASDDQYGLKIQLSNSNIASRVLPIRIHDLDKDDKKLFESAVGSVIRSIDFIYKEAGVNRQLREKDDDIIKSQPHVLYRDQINKAALAIKEIIDSMKSGAAGKNLIKNSTDPASEGVIKSHEYNSEMAMSTKTNPENTTGNVIKVKDSIPGFLSKYKMLIISAFCILITVGVISLIMVYNSKKKWAREIGLQQLINLQTQQDYNAAFNLFPEVEKYIPNDPELISLKTRISGKLTILTDPPGAEVLIKDYSSKEEKWEKIGKTPIDSISLPIKNFYHIKIIKENYKEVEAVGVVKSGLRIDTLYRKLFKTGEIPEGMVYVEGYGNELSSLYLKKKNGFFLDRYEVTNKHYKEFVDKGGYSNQKYWKNEFIKNGNVLTWEEAIKQFVDKTGQPGPATWAAGDYPEGMENYPVTGVSWYEAAAFAEYSGKSLPTRNHWSSGAGLSIINMNFYTLIASVSNFENQGPAEAGKYRGVNLFGAYDMAGNVREWCWNSTEIGKVIRGGAWDDATYLYRDISQLSSFDRSEKNGFRCALYLDIEKVPKTAFDPIKVGLVRDYYNIKPVNEATFNIYKTRFVYDKTELNPNVEQIEFKSDDWTVEEVSINTAYGNERMIVYLFLPKKFKSPFQTLVYFPGAGALDTKHFSPTTRINEFLAKTGRAFVFPIYKGTYERNDGKTNYSPNSSVQYSEDLIKWVKDFRRTIDYLESRNEIDTSRIGYYGYSWGGRLGGIIPAIEPRIKLSILINGGYSTTTDYPLPEVDEYNYVPRIKTPVLMLNGKYDFLFPLKSTVKPFFENIGTPGKDKRLVIYDTDHYVPYNEMTKEMLSWLDKYFGSAKR